MSNLAVRVLPEAVRELGFVAIDTAYMGVGTALSNPAHVVFIQNLTDVDVMISWDGIDDHIPLAANGFFLMDVTSNKTSTGGAFMIAQGTRFYAKYTNDAPSGGSVFISVFYGAKG